MGIKFSNIIKKKCIFQKKYKKTPEMGVFLGHFYLPVFSLINARA
jgi:hypothetical protein